MIADQKTAKDFTGVFSSGIDVAHDRVLLLKLIN
jgi:hypothetical protein